MEYIIEQTPFSLYVIEGNIGVGKSTLISKMKKNYEYSNNDNYHFLFTLEPINNLEYEDEKKSDSIISMFYKNPKDYALLFHIHITILMINKIVKLCNIINKCECDKEHIIISERSIVSVIEVFMLNCLENEWIDNWSFNHFYTMFKDNLYQIYRKIKHVFILDLDEKICHERIIRRNNIYEKNITMSYLESLRNKINETFIQRNKTMAYTLIDCNYISDIPQILYMIMEVILNKINN